MCTNNAHHPIFFASSNQINENRKMNSRVYIPESEEFTYGELLQTMQWKNKRKLILKRDNHACKNCGSMNNLQVHHRQYHYVTTTNNKKLPWEYLDKYLVTLCRKCHESGHKQHLVPFFNL